MFWRRAPPHNKSIRSAWPGCFSSGAVRCGCLFFYAAPPLLMGTQGIGCVLMSFRNTPAFLAPRSGELPGEARLRGFSLPACGRRSAPDRPGCCCPANLPLPAALHQPLLHAPLGCLGGIRVCHVCKGRGVGRLGTACGVPQQQRGLGAVLGCSHAFRQQGLQLLAGNVVVHAVAYNASRHCAAAATMTTAPPPSPPPVSFTRVHPPITAARVIAAGGRRYRGNRAAGASHIQCEDCPSRSYHQLCTDNHSTLRLCLH